MSRVDEESASDDAVATAPMAAVVAAMLMGVRRRGEDARLLDDMDRLDAGLEVGLDIEPFVGGSIAVCERIYANR